jgi:hypothetical protein
MPAAVSVALHPVIYCQQSPCRYIDRQHQTLQNKQRDGFADSARTGYKNLFCHYDLFFIFGMN